MKQIKGFLKYIDWSYWLIVIAFLLGFFQGYFSGEIETLKEQNKKSLQEIGDRLAQYKKQNIDMAIEACKVNPDRKDLIDSDHRWGVPLDCRRFLADNSGGK